MATGSIPSALECRPQPGSPPPRVRRRALRSVRACATASSLGRYVDAAGRQREIIAAPAAERSVLVIDRDAVTLQDRRLVAHLAPDEPPVNAQVVCRRYLADPARGRPRAVGEDDLIASPLAPPRRASTVVAAREGAWLTDGSGCRYRLCLVSAGSMEIPELRWTRRPPIGHSGPAAVVSLRQVIGRLQDYQPARDLSMQAVYDHRRDSAVSVAALRAELDRIARSRIVLNRALREAVVRAVNQEGLSMSTIATRCGRVKRDRRGNLSGETSWLARRLGLAPEGGEQRPTPWIHTDVLALIARAGLGIAPREVELA